MKNSKYLVIQICLILVIIFLAFMIFRSLMRPEKFKNIYDGRKADVVLKLEDIRILQTTYKAEKGSYASTFNQLRDFWNNGRITIVVKEGTVPDTLTEEQALKLNIIRRDTVRVDAKEEILKEIGKLRQSEKYKSKTLPDFDIDKFDIIPYSKGERFHMEADTVVRANIPVYVFEVIARKSQYLKDLDSDPRVKDVFLGKLLYSGLQGQYLGPNFDYRDNVIDLVLGSLTEPSTDGNWE